MSKKKSATSTPFFARYLEGQVGSTQTSAEVRSSSGRAYAKAKAKPAPKTLVTLKFPSDSDELHYFPYYRNLNDIPEKYREPLQTLKFPSDSDEHSYEAAYLTKTAVPKGTPKPGGGKIQLKKTALKLR